MSDGSVFQTTVGRRSPLLRLASLQLCLAGQRGGQESSPEPGQQAVQGLLPARAHGVPQSDARVLAHGEDVVVEVRDPQAEELRQ